MRVRRTVTVVIGSAAVALSAAACTTHAGAAAQVGSTRITTDQLSGLVNRGLAAAKGDPNAQVSDVPNLQRQQLTNLVTTQLVQRVADQQGVSISSQQVAEYRTTAAAIQFGGNDVTLVEALRTRGVAPADVDGLVRLSALTDAVEDKVAPDVTATNAEILQAYNQLKQQYGDKFTISLTAAAPQISRLLTSQQRSAKLVPLLLAVEKKDGVSVNPRFGTWNAETLQVGAANGSISRTAPGSVLPTPILTS